MPSLYIHVPFCDGKCPYCDFYSLRGEPALLDAYTRKAAEALGRWGAVPVETVYFGGGTPNLLGAGRLAFLLETVQKRFRLAAGAEVTVECNPTHVGQGFFADLRAAGFNRLSMGMQSAWGDELRLLGRAHSPQDVAQAAGAAQRAGFGSISLDLMLALPGGDRQKLGRSIAFASGLGVQHISSYILKVEEGTPFAGQGLNLPDEDEAADQYLFCVEELARRGYAQYEISNFSRPGFESRHNLVYWQGKEYIGIGPGAHSFYKGRRLHYPRDLRGFLDGGALVDDGPGGSFEEFAMLNLRLARGLVQEECAARFGRAGSAAFMEILENTKGCPPHLLQADRTRIRFMPEGFLVSNALLLRLLKGVGGSGEAPMQGEAARPAEGRAKRAGDPPGIRG